MRVHSTILALAAAVAVDGIQLLQPERDARADPRGGRAMGDDLAPGRGAAMDDGMDRGRGGGADPYGEDSFGDPSMQRGGRLPEMTPPMDIPAMPQAPVRGAAPPPRRQLPPSRAPVVVPQPPVAPVQPPPAPVVPAPTPAPVYVAPPPPAMPVAPLPAVPVAPLPAVPAPLPPAPVPTLPNAPLPISHVPGTLNCGTTGDVVNHKTKNFPLPYPFFGPTAPNMFLGIPSYDGPHPSVAQLMAVDNDSFAVRVDEPNSCFDEKHTSEEFAWLALESGVHVTDEGVQFEVGYINHSENMNPGGGDWQDVIFKPGMFATKPIVLTSPQQHQDDQWFSVRIEEVTTQGFRLNFQSAKKGSKDHMPPEPVSWIAIPESKVGGGHIAGRKYIAATSGKEVNHKFHKVRPAGLDEFKGIPLVFGQIQTYKGGQPSTTRMKRLSKNLQKRIRKLKKKTIPKCWKRVKHLENKSKKLKKKKKWIKLGINKVKTKTKRAWCEGKERSLKRLKKRLASGDESISSFKVKVHETQKQCGYNKKHSKENIGFLIVEQA